MKILYDHQMFTMQKFGGITRYFCDLMLNLPDGYEYDLPIQYSENYHLRDLGIRTKIMSDYWPFRIKRRYYYLKNNGLSMKILHKNRFDVFHPTYYDDYFLKHNRKPFIITIHDLTHEKFCGSFLFYDKTASQKRFLVQHASHIIAISENTKKDLVELYHVNPDNITVVYHGFKQSHEPGAPLYDNYLLYVGDRKGYKNFYPFIEAITPLLKSQPELKVVCTGKSFSDKEKSWFISHGIGTQIIQRFASDRELASLYKYALAFVYPSLYEGFGIPILESFYNQCPVCLSDVSCFPEIAMDAACYFNPADKESIHSTINKIIEDRGFADSLRMKGLERLKLFSIDNMVQNTCKIYDLFS